jgi:hypothetical protein
MLPRRAEFCGGTPVRRPAFGCSRPDSGWCGTKYNRPMPLPRLRSYHQSTAKALGVEPLAAHAEIARIAVLYEDLRIELTAASENEMPKLDTINARHRKTYFLRRAVATLREFGEAIRFLQGLPEFGSIRRSFEDSEAIQMWNDAVRFFKDNAQYLQQIRNAVGGHFSRSAAAHAIKAIDPGIIGSIEINFKDGKANPKAFFVDALVDEAMLERRGNRTREEYAAGMIAFAMTGFNHASSCLHVLLLHYLIPRFGQG